MANDEKQALLKITFPLRPGNTGNIFLQLAHNIVALQVEKRCCTYYHPPQTLLRNKISLLQVEAACCVKLNWGQLFQRIFSTCNNKFCCVTMFEVRSNTYNNAFQLAMQQFVARITLPLRTTKIWNASDCYIEK